MTEVTDKKCPFCAEMIKVEAIKCKHCGSSLASLPGQITTKTVAHYETEKRSVGTAYILWLVLGGLGAHKFYMSNVLAGFFYIGCLCLSWLYLPLELLIVLWICDGFTLGNSVYEFNDRLLNPKKSPTPTTAPAKKPGEGDFLNWFFGVKPRTSSTNKPPNESIERIKTEPDQN